MTDQDLDALEKLLEQAARARRLAFAIDDDPAAQRLEQFADELEAEFRFRAVSFGYRS